ncbi:class I SAM-dependent methyltransferase [Oceanicaulis sp. MMSF_3324]|uniref:class I SAM-dependent methyltransferase n=1 Tax=Oceanicaulis sp. MMSF_3324 TaxID=3046702 RepID=UPI00273EC586|nr:class I SAM-dependent methyltransferase [Oceanicaulis sp. MMSF_3324]
MTSNPFDQGGARYAAGRPVYPAKLAFTLEGLVSNHKLAVDVGCGTGQLSILLAEYFKEVRAFDPSDSQLAHARPHPRVSYAKAPAEALPVASGSANLITAAQAAHWFDRPRFYAEVRRIAAPGAVLALITYNNAEADTEAMKPIGQLYKALDAWWRPEREDVETAYSRFDFPFDEIPAKGGAIVHDWTFDEMRAYLESWSALRAARADGEDKMIDGYLDQARQAWGEGEIRVRWPITIRAGYVHKPVRS